MRVLVTGATGFVGQALVRRLAGTPGWTVRACVRTPAVWPVCVEQAVVGDIGPATDWGDALAGVDVVVHLAARVHVMGGAAADAGEYSRVNVHGTQRLAQSAHAAGVRRLVFLSSLKVHGEAGGFTERSPLSPSDPYAVSKRDAEAALREVSSRTGLEVVMIRPPLVYGPGVKANFLSLVAIVKRGLPLPLASVTNRRSFVGVDNLVDLIVVCLTHPAAAGEAFLVSDGNDLSTPELIRRIAAANRCPARLWPVPVALLTGLAAVTGRSHAIERLTGSLSVDITRTRELLGWTPPCSVDEQLTRMTRAD